MRLGIRRIKPDDPDLADIDEKLRQFRHQFAQDTRAIMVNYDDCFQTIDEGGVIQLALANKQLWFLVTEGADIGYITYSQNTLPYRQCAWIYEFFLDVAYRNQGLGRSALRMVKQKIFALHPTVSRIGIAVLHENAIARHLYATQDFSESMLLLITPRPEGILSSDKQ